MRLGIEAMLGLERRSGGMARVAGLSRAGVWIGKMPFFLHLYTGAG